MRIFFKDIFPKFYCKSIWKSYFRDTIISKRNRNRTMNGKSLYYAFRRKNQNEYKLKINFKKIVNLCVVIVFT